MSLVPASQPADRSKAVQSSCIGQLALVNWPHWLSCRQPTLTWPILFRLCSLLLEASSSLQVESLESIGSRLEAAAAAGWFAKVLTALGQI